MPVNEALCECRVEIEERQVYRAVVDADQLIAEFSEEWKAFLAEDPATDEAKRSFVKECIAVMGAADFFSEAPWASTIRSDHEQDVSVTP